MGRPTQEKANDDNRWCLDVGHPGPRALAQAKGIVPLPTATLVDLVVLGLFAEYWDQVRVGSFTIMLLAAALLQLLLKVTIAMEHRFAAFFSARPGGFAKFMRFFSAWVCCSDPSS